MVGDNSGTLSGNINGMAGVEVLTPTRAQACAYDITATVTGTAALLSSVAMKRSPGPRPC